MYSIKWFYSGERGAFLQACRGLNLEAIGSVSPSQLFMTTTAGRKERGKGGRLTGRTDMQNANEGKEEEVALLTFWSGAATESSLPIPRTPRRTRSLSGFGKAS